MAKKKTDKSRLTLPSGEVFLRETRKTEPTSPLRTLQRTDWGRRTGRDPMKLIIEAQCYILFGFFWQQKVYRKLQRAGCSEAIFITVDQPASVL